MPSKNEVKIYVENGYYHLYNRGVEKRNIFEDKEDYSVFLSYLKDYLLPKNTEELQKRLADPNTSYKEKDKIIKLLRLNNFANEITLVAYALAPNHYHLLIKQKSPYAIDKFSNSLITRYSMYFNRKRQRVGPLFQGVYKAVLVETNEQLLHLTRYIHLHSLRNTKGCPSSYQNYLGLISQEWVKPQEILSFFKTAQKTSLKDILSYQSFVEDYQKDLAGDSEEILRPIILE